MKLFITGSQTSEFIKETLEGFQDEFCLSEVVTSALSPCTEAASEWCKDNFVPITIYLPEDLTEKAALECNRDAITGSRPNFILIYNENEHMCNMIARLVYHVDSVEFVARKSEID